MSSTSSSSPSKSSSNNPLKYLFYYDDARRLPEQGFSWKRRRDAQPYHRKLYFDDEWRRFRSLITEITGICSPPSEQTSPFECFQDVIDPAGSKNDNTMHKNEHAFSNALFDALQTSLHGFVEPKDPDTEEENWIVLKNSHIGFGQGISRSKLGFKEKDSQDQRSYHHGCYVLGSNRTKKRKSPDALNEFLYDDDATAIVLLKKDSKSCQPFEKYEVIHRGQDDSPDMRKRHGLVKELILNGLDVWYCLARRGQSVESVPMVFLAGKTKEELDTDLICGFDGCLEIPEYCGDDFLWFFDQIVSFRNISVVKETAEKTAMDEATAVDTVVETATDRNSRDEQAIAIYIKTMCIGLEHALAISKNRYESNALSPPVSVCFRQFLPTCQSAQLVASSIPNANSVPESCLRIYQGELFTLASPTKENFPKFPHFYWFVDAEEDEVMTTNCLIKVSRAGCHSTYVSRDSCHSALYRLYDTCRKNLALKHEMAKVLMGFTHKGSGTLVIVMKDLRNENFVKLDHQKIRDEGKLPQLWSAFCVLVQSLLLPMARDHIIHYDIRSTTKVTYNILVAEIVEGDDHQAFELRLIDFDSVISGGSTRFSSSQKDAVYWDHLDYTVTEGVKWESVYRFLFWQVLWIAYTWHPPGAEPSTQEKDIDARLFLLFLFREDDNDNHCLDFKNWLGKSAFESLKAMNGEEIAEATIMKALDVLGDVFCDKASQES